MTYFACAVPQEMILGHPQQATPSLPASMATGTSLSSTSEPLTFTHKEHDHCHIRAGDRIKINNLLILICIID